jgi:PilZ domain
MSKLPEGRWPAKAFDRSVEALSAPTSRSVAPLGLPQPIIIYNRAARRSRTIPPVPIMINSFMRLPAHLLQKIIGRPVDHFSGSGHKRLLGRVEIDGQASVFPIHGEVLDDPINVTLEDVSAETVGLVMPQAMMPASNLVIRIRLSDGQYLAIRCQVMRCSRQTDGRFRLVAQFQDLVDPQTTFTLLDRSEN